VENEISKDKRPDTVGVESFVVMYSRTINAKLFTKMSIFSSYRLISFAASRTSSRSLKPNSSKRS